MKIVVVLQIILYVIGIALLVIGASPPGPRGRRWRIELLGWACIVTGFVLPTLASAAT